MTLQQIQDAIPHRKPMLLVDEIIEQDENRIVCRKTFAADEFFFQGHYPDFAITPGVILCECAVQAGAVLLSELTRESEGVPVLTRLSDVRFKQMVRPGESIESEVKIEDIVSSAYYCSAKVTCNGKLAVRFTFACTIAPRA
ncbi:MAG: 3-hydroxyacyl-ACP dehydratase FabZ family protein [Planctomycetota bacterium]|nr:3-hydroxyacyl-ACP dehydratase FabZ family protein [Planctomycetota bacterium]